MRSESFPCLVCGAVLYRDMDEYEAQPREGVMCETSGNYGSTVFDPMNGEYLHFNVCDRCVVRAGEQGRLFVTQHAIGVQTDCPIEGGKTLLSQVGWRRVERPYLPWTVDMPPADEKERLTIEEILELFDSDSYKWNLSRDDFEWMKREMDRDDPTTTGDVDAGEGQEA